jgi:hypothetical protein
VLHAYQQRKADGTRLIAVYGQPVWFCPPCNPKKRRMALPTHGPQPVLTMPAGHCDHWVGHVQTVCVHRGPYAGAGTGLVQGTTHIAVL